MARRLLSFGLLLATGVVGCAEEDGTATGPTTSDEVGVEVTIDSPVDGALVAGPQVSVRGRVTGAVDGVRVTVGGVTVPTNAGRFDVLLDLPDGTTSVTASVPTADGAVTAQVDFVVDALPPALVLRGPARGHTTSDAAAVVELASFDENGLVRLEVNGAALDPSAGPEWSTTVALSAGLNTIRLLAEDGAGHVTTEDVSVLAGPFGLAEAEYDDAVVVHIGPDALAATGSLAAAAIASLDLTTLAKALNPVLDNDLAQVDVTHVSVAPGSLVEVIPAEDGITVRAVIDDLELSGELSLKTGSQTVYDAELTIQQIVVTVPLVVTPTDGVFEATLQEPTFEFVQPKVTVQGGELGAELEGQIIDTVEELLSSVALEAGGNAIAAALKRLTEPFSYTVLDVQITVQLTAASVEVGDGGLDLRLSGRAFVDGDAIKPDTIGVPRTPDQPAYFPVGPDVAIALSDDLVNGLLHALWRYGVADLQVDNELMKSTKSGVTLVAGFLGSLLELGNTGVDPEAEMIVRFDAPLPPAVVPPPAPGSIALGIGDLGLAFETVDGSIATGYLNLRLAAGALSTTEGVLLDLQPYFTGFDLAVDDAAAKRQLESTIEPFVSTFLGELAPVLQSILGPIPLPSFSGLTLTDLSVGDDDSAGAYLVIRGTAAPAP